MEVELGTSVGVEIIDPSYNEQKIKFSSQDEIYKISIVIIPGDTAIHC